MSDKKYILIIEDDPDMLDIYKSMFKTHEDRYEIETVTDARIGFKKLEEGKFNLAIVDIVMEPMSGDTLLACVKDDEKMQDIPIIVISVLNKDDLGDQFEKMPNVEILQKPITADILFGTIGRMLEQ